MKDSMSVENNLEMYPNGRNESPYGGRCGRMVQINYGGLGGAR